MKFCRVNFSDELMTLTLRCFADNGTSYKGGRLHHGDLVTVIEHDSFASLVLAEHGCGWCLLESHELVELDP